MTHLVFGGVQPGGTVRTKLSTVGPAVCARAQRTWQCGVLASAEHARRTCSLVTSRSVLDASRVNEGMTADTEINAAWNCTRRAVDNRRPTEVKTSTTDARPRHQTVLHSAEDQPVRQTKKLQLLWNDVNPKEQDKETTKIHPSRKTTGSVMTHVKT